MKRSICVCCLTLLILSFAVLALSVPLFCRALGCYQEGITAVEHKVLPLPLFLSSLSLSLSLALMHTSAIYRMQCHSRNSQIAPFAERGSCNINAILLDSPFYMLRCVALPDAHLGVFCFMGCLFYSTDSSILLSDLPWWWSTRWSTKDAGVYDLSVDLLDLLKHIQVYNAETSFILVHFRHKSVPPRIHHGSPQFENHSSRSPSPCAVVLSGVLNSRNIHSPVDSSFISDKTHPNKLINVFRNRHVPRSSVD